MKLKSLLALAIALLFSASGWAQTDVTSTYITNADFEGGQNVFANPSEDRAIYQPEGWEISYTNGNGSDMTALNSDVAVSSGVWNQFKDKPQLATGGSKTYWMRFRWANNENITLTQETSSNLPAGTYCVSVDAYSDDNTSNITISAAGTSQTIRANSAWTNYKVVFTLASAQKVTVTLSYSNTAADDHVAAFDNVKILDLTSEPTGVALKNELGGTSADLSDFIITDGDYTLEVAGTAGNEITVAADNISYTPEATGTVRFVKKDGIVYVYEGATYKKAVNSSAEAITLADITNDNVTSDGSGNLLQNASFETLGDVKSGTQYYPGTPWSGNYPGSSRVQSATEIGNKQAADNGTYVIVWRGGASNNIGQAISGLKPNHTYKVQARQIYANNGTGAFRFGLGTSVGNVDYGYVDLTLGGSDDKTRKTISGTFVTSSSTPANGYFTMTGCQGGGDKMPCLDWLSLVCQDAFPITGASSASYIYGTAYAPATAKASYLAAKAEAEATIADATYDNVTGSERTNLQAAIDADVADNDAAYNTATENIQNKLAAFTAALTHYQALIDAQAAVPDLAYASTAASAFKTAVATSASDADAKVAAMTTDIRAYYESHALAEGNATTVNYTHVIANPDAMDANNGWTWDGPKNDPKNNEPWTDASGNSSHWYFDGGNWNAGSWTTTMSQDITLPAGTYLLTAKGRAATNTTLTMSACGEEVALPHVSSTGNVFDRGWGDASLEFTSDGSDVTITVTATTSTIHEWFSVCDFRLVRLDATLATSDDYADLNDAITDAEDKTLGFVVGQYAPYNNVEALTKLAEAKAINQSANNEQSVVQGLTTYLNTAGNWHANATNVDIIFNGMFATQDGDDTKAKGWTRTNGWGQIQTEVEGDYTTAYYNQPGSLKYGDTGVYTMPLNEEEYYGLTFSYRSHENNSNGGVTASVLNAEDGLAAVAFTANGSTTVWKTVTAYFKTGAAGNYVLTLANSGNTWITNVSLTPYGIYSNDGYYDEDYGCYLDLDKDEVFYPEVELYRRYTKAGNFNKWSTFVVPFDITNEELKSAFGHYVEVAEFSENSGDANDVTVNFTKMETPAITANKPVLLKYMMDSDEDTFDFSNKVVRTCEEEDAKVAGTNIDFAGIYFYTDPEDCDYPFTIPAGDYFIGDGALYKSEGATTIRPFRAYLKCKGEPASVKLFIDDVETGIEEIQGLEFKAQGSEIYNLAGQRMSKAQKGVNIINGKKVLVK